MPFVAAFVSAEAAAAAVTAAEIAAATEAAAAAATAAEAATAAQTAQAAQAAQAASASQAGIMGAQATGTGATGSGIMGAQAAPGGIAGVPQAAGSTVGTTAGELGMALPEGFGQQLQNVQNLTQGPSFQVASTDPSAAMRSLQGAPSATSSYSLTGSSTAPGPSPYHYQLGQPGGSPQLGTGASGIKATPTSTNLMYQSPQPGPMDKAMAFAKENPFMTGAAMYTGAYNLGLLDPRGSEMPEKRSYGNQLTLSKDFKASEATPDIYQPTYKTYAEGGVMTVGNPSSEMPEPRKVLSPMATVSSMAEGGVPGYARGGSLSSSLDFYRQMAEGQPRKASSDKGDVGIYYDQDPDTRYQDALTAAQIRQAKVNKRANMQIPGMKRPNPLGQINLAPPGVKAKDQGATEAAQGGIMQAGSSLGGYAAGGNPRLLKGPGDGMSDNIPAMIGRKQPARLADGEFVIPADVVSHLGNGSTEAGAKRLHEMMNKVRRARTGNPKQGKQINPNKYMPK